MHERARFDIGVLLNITGGSFTPRFLATSGPSALANIQLLASQAKFTRWHFSLVTVSELELLLK